MKKIACMLGSACIAILLLELCFRYYFYRWNTGRSVPFSLFRRPFPHAEGIDKLITQSSDPKLLFELTKNSRYFFKGKQFLTNSDGALGATEYSRQKPKNTIRVVGVGDSIMSSWGVDPSATYLAYLERHLSKVATPLAVQVINLSVPGYNTAIETDVIEKKALRYDPDLIILGFCGNDLDLPNYIRKKVYAKSYALFVVQTALEMITSSILPRQHDNAGIQPLAFTPQIVTKNPGSIDTYTYTMGVVPPEYQYMIGVENYVNNMKKIADMTAKAGVPVILIHYSDNLATVSKITTMGFHILVMDETIIPYLQSNDLDESDIILGNNDPHLNEIGHGLYAQILYQFIMDDPELHAIVTRPD